MNHVFGDRVILKTRIFGIMLHLLTDLVVAESALLSTKNGGNQWTPSVSLANSYVVRYPSQSENSSIPVASLSKEKSSRAFGDNYIDGGTFDYTGYSDKAVPVNEPSSSIAAGPAHPGATTVITNSFPLANQQYPLSYPYPGGGGYYYPVPSYLPPTQYWPPSQTFNTFDYGGGLYPPGNSTGWPQMNTEDQFLVQPNMCSNSIRVARSRDVVIRTSFRYDTNQTYVCIVMLYGANQYSRLAISLKTNKIQQRANSVTLSDTWLLTNVKMYAVQGENITFIDTK